MAKVVNKETAIKVVENSDFFQSRQPRANRSLGPLAMESLRSHFVGETERDAMMRRHFLRLTLNAFEEQRPTAIADGLYDYEELVKWLDALFAEEVRKEMGDIPKV